MTDFDWVAIARDVLASVEVPALATSGADGAVRVVVVGGELADGVFQWRSFPERVHSKQVAENPNIAFNFFDPATRREVYGTATVKQTEEEGKFQRYFAPVKELWVVIDEQVDGKYLEPQPLEPSTL